MYVPERSKQWQTGEQHKKQRKMLNPVFSLANMRELLPIIQPIADKLREVLLTQIPSDGSVTEIDIMPWMSRGTLEYISQAGLGYSFNALDPAKKNTYAEAVKSLAPAALRIILLRPFVPMIMRNFSLYWRNKMVDWLPIQALRDVREIVNVMDNASKQVFAEKKAALGRTTEQDSARKMDGGGDVGARMRGKDIMSIMVRANASSDETDRLTDAELLGQMNTIIFAGFETTTTALCRTLYIMASRPSVQARLRNEIRKAKRDYAASNGILLMGNGDGWENVELPYDVLVGLPYLDAILRETLRVFPPTSLLSRTTRKDIVLPLQYPVRSFSGAEITAIPLRENTTVIMSLLGANHNKEIWGEDASIWRPERWLTPWGERIGIGKDVDGTLGDAQGGGGAEGAPGNKGGVKYPGVYASMMTFLGGGRACIGFKFAEMELKQVLTTLLSNIHFSLPSDKEIYWKNNGLQVPVVRPPAGDFQTPQVPLNTRLVREDDFSA
ncbi:hypothetical protein AcW1_002875 [Taiwanofungus camphoratus]|nr:hypothetical protein AcV5_009458 [Antrodia cinnamomea]KAI0943174.1 hypothetical protein AcV7_002396 [Antrodia cinnamomea]KAI0943799.1 hypothetical protein AcW1_002875 [Antrodia cinnamomea]